jgi:hypothetical protein
MTGAGGGWGSIKVWREAADTAASLILLRIASFHLEMRGRREHHCSSGRSGLLSVIPLFCCWKLIVRRSNSGVK